MTTALRFSCPRFLELLIFLCWGSYFRSRSINRSNTELLVLVTPRIVDPVHTETSAPPEAKPPIPYLDNPKFDDKLPGAKKSQTVNHHRVRNE